MEVSNKESRKKERKNKGVRKKDEKCKSCNICTVWYLRKSASQFFLATYIHHWCWKAISNARYLQ